MSEGGAADRVAFVVPLFEDWECLERLLVDVAESMVDSPPPIVIVINDGSVTPWDGAEHVVDLRLERVDVVDLAANLGHQRAVCVGLSRAVQLAEVTRIVVMDADGEDRPSHVPVLLQVLADGGAPVVVAQRRQRTEGLQFRFFYKLYRLLFHLLTGENLDFGNFSVLTIDAARRVVYMAELWNNYPATLMRSRLPINRVPIDRGHRYTGTTRMSFVSLVNHGLGAMSVFMDRVFARLLVAVTAAFILAAVVAVIALVVRVVIEVALPGWLALSAVVAVMLLVQVLAVVIVSTFIIVSNRTRYSRPPGLMALEYVTAVRTWEPGPSAAGTG